MKAAARHDSDGANCARPSAEPALAPRERAGAFDGASGRGDGNALNEQRTKDAMEQIDAADTDRAERVTVIGLAQTKEALLRRLAAERPVLERLLERDLDRRRAGVRVEDAAKISRRDLE